MEEKQTEKSHRFEAQIVSTLSREQSTGPNEVAHKSKSISFRLAQSFEELCACYRIVHDEYVRSGYTNHQQSGMRYSELVFLSPHTTGLVFLNGALVGTGTTILDTQAGLPCYNTFAYEINKLRNEGHLLAEGTMLACLSGYASQGPKITKSLLPYGLAWSHLKGATDWLVVVNPKHLFFWKDIVGMTIVGQPRQCSHVQGHPGILLRLPLEHLAAGVAENKFQQYLVDAWPDENALDVYKLQPEDIAFLRRVNQDYGSSASRNRKHVDTEQTGSRLSWIFRGPARICAA